MGKIAKFIGRSYLTSRFIIRTLSDGFLNPFRDLECDTSRKLLILANGPSLKDFLLHINKNIENYYDCDFSVVNDFVHNDLFKVIRPKFYTLTDPKFFVPTIYKENGFAVVQALKDKVDWDMYLQVNCEYKKSEGVRILLQNPFIHIVYFHLHRYEGFHTLRNWFMSKGLSNGEYSTVVLNSLYAAITEGYKNIELYGVDHTFFHGLTVNDDNIPCYRAVHFYDTESDVKPMVNHYAGDFRYFDMASFMYEKYDIFRGHKIMSLYAEYMNAEVLNCTPGSLIDAYKRKKV